MPAHVRRFTFLLWFSLVTLCGHAAFAQLPEARNAPKAGEKAPDFTLPDSEGKPFRLSEALASEVGGQRVKGILLVVYRGYW